MFEQTVRKMVDSQIEKGTLKEEDRNIYRYGYQIMIEFGINITVSILIAVLFRAYDIVIVFTAAYLWLRGCAGGYHARTNHGCFGMSAGMLIAVIVAVQYVNGLQSAAWTPFAAEVIMMPFICRHSPIPHKNRPISENERIHFKRKVKIVYSAELAAAFVLQYLGQPVCALTILAVHAILFIMAALHLLKHDES